MFKNKWLAGVFIIVLAGILYYSLSTELPFDEQIDRNREDYKQSMLSMEDSPIDLDTFEEFHYFPSNEAFVFTGNFKPAKSGETFSLLMTDSTRNNIPFVGTASFTIDNQLIELKIFDEEDTYLLPFTDETNGGETYGGGRYINIEKKELAGDKITIDFNKAHNFYCSYNDKYVCPIPPAENKINALIDAGEKKYHHE